MIKGGKTKNTKSNTPKQSDLVKGNKIFKQHSL